MIIPTDPDAIARCTKALRQGRITNDYTPGHVADLIDALSQAIIDMRAYLDEVERVYLTPATQSALRTEYARGFAAAQRQLAERCPDHEPLIMSVKPSFIAASSVVRG